MARNHIFSFRKNFLVAAILLYKKQKKWRSTSDLAIHQLVARNPFSFLLVFRRSENRRRGPTCIPIERNINNKKLVVLLVFDFGVNRHVKTLRRFNYLHRAKPNKSSYWYKCCYHCSINRKIELFFVVIHVSWCQLMSNIKKVVVFQSSSACSDCKPNRNRLFYPSESRRKRAS